jgi:uncharacterized damage-inducible protein DinB
MPTAGAEFAEVIERIARDALAALDGLSDELLNQPVPLPEANTLYALATHLAGAGEFWTLVLAGGRTIPRDRPAEFHASGTLADLVARYERWIANLHAVLDTLPDAALERHADPTPYRAWQGDEPLTVRACLLHAVEHSALHLGHLQLTRQLLAGEQV